MSIVKNAVRCGICQSPADLHHSFYICQRNPAHMGDTYVGIFTDCSYPDEKRYKKDSSFKSLCKLFLRKYYYSKCFMLIYGLEQCVAVVNLRNNISPRDIEWMVWCDFLQNADWYVNFHPHCNRNILRFRWAVQFVKKAFKI